MGRQPRPLTFIGGQPPKIELLLDEGDAEDELLDEELEPQGSYACCFT